MSFLIVVHVNEGSAVKQSLSQNRTPVILTRYKENAEMRIRLKQVSLSGKKRRCVGQLDAY